MFDIIDTSLYSSYNFRLSSTFNGNIIILESLGFGIDSNNFSNVTHVFNHEHNNNNYYTIAFI